MFNNITKKLFLILFTMTFILSLVYTAVIFLVAYVTEDSLLNRMLTFEAANISADAPNNHVLPAYIKYYESESELPSQLRTALQQHPAETEFFIDNRIHYHLKHIYHGNNKFGILVAEVSNLLVVTTLAKELTYFFIAVALFMLIIATFLALITAKYIAAPIKLLTTEVDNFTQDSDISNRLLDREDEVGFLANKLNVTMNEIVSALKRERNFTSDISHELRTPLTYINNYASGLDTTLPDYTNFTQAIDEMNNIIATLLAIARQENLIQEKLHLLTVIEQVVISQHDNLVANHNKIAINVDTNHYVLANQQLLSLLFRNVIENAIFHGNQAQTIDIICKNNTLIVTNQCDAMEQRTRTTHNFGHGTHLIEKLVNSQQLTFTKKDQGEVYIVEIDLAPISIR